MTARYDVSRRMAAVRQKETCAELALRAALRSAGVTGYRLNLRTFPGAPDVAFTKWKVAVFVDGAFWHGHPKKFPEERMSAYWRAKIARTRQRDLRVTDALRQNDWEVLRFWDFEVEANARDVIARIKDALRRSGRALPRDA
jgi:DNA mismatch endonuclease (patch repair protein)